MKLFLMVSISVLLLAKSAYAIPIEQLINARDNFQQIQETNIIIPPGPTLKVGSDNDRVLLLTRKLSELDYNIVPATLFTDEVSNVVQQFQMDRSSNPDGVVGNQTIDSLNTIRARALSSLNQAITEWNSKIGIPQDHKYIVVNIPSFELIAYENGVEVLRSRIIVGSPQHQTPEMLTNAYSIKFNPDWTAPPGIRSRYAARWNPGERAYFQKHGVQVSRDANGSLRFYQSPRNSYLGKLKVELDNPYNVYLHDTNSPRLFSEPPSP